MTSRLLLATALTILTAAFGVAGPRAVGAQDEGGGVTLKIASLDRVAGPWERPLSAWQTQIRRDTEGSLQIEYDERGGNPVERMAAGEIDGAFLSTISLSEIHSSFQVLNAPGVIEDYDALDKVRSRLGDRFARVLASRDYILIGWFDLGRTRLFSTRPVRQPSDLRGLKGWVMPDEAVFDAFLEAGGARRVRLPVDRVRAAIPSRVNLIGASALAAYGMEWYPELPYVSEQARGVVVGMTVVRKERFESLSDAQKSALTDTSERVHSILRRRLRAQDDRLYQTILSREGTQAFDMSAHRDEWRALSEQTRNALAGRVFPQALLRSVMRAAR